MPYCTGDTHAGEVYTASEETFNLYFSGRINFDAILDDLKSSEGLDNATHVLLSGSSAGGVGTFLNADRGAAAFPNAVFKAAPIAGWFIPQVSYA